MMNIIIINSEISLCLSLSFKKRSGHIDSDAQTDSGALGWRLRRSVQRSFLTCLSTSEPTHRTGRTGTI